MPNNGWRPPTPKELLQPALKDGRYSKRQVDRDDADFRKSMRPKTRRALDRFEATAGQDASELLTFNTWPNHTIDRTRPRTVAAGYDSKSNTLFVEFRNGENGRGSHGGALYAYYRVHPNTWKNVRRTGSEGRNIINKALEGHPFKRIR
jgi:hypothetical protein